MEMYSARKPFAILDRTHPDAAIHNHSTRGSVGRPIPKRIALHHLISRKTPLIEDALGREF